MQLKTAPLAVALAGSLLTAPAMAEGLLHWQSNSLPGRLTRTLT